MNVSLYAEFEALEGQERNVADLVAEFAGRVRAEPGNVVFDPFIVAGSGAFFVVETYIDESAFALHLSSDHGREFNDRLGPLIVGGQSTLTQLDAIEVAK